MTRSNLVIGVDPGDSTGIGGLRDGKLVAAFQGPARDAVIIIETVLERYPHDDVTIACERFTERGRTAKTHQPVAQQVCGVIEAVAIRYAVHLIWQGPADAWAMADNTMLRRLGLFRSLRDVQQSDANDVNMALRHALLCLATRHAATFDAMLKKTES